MEDLLPRENWYKSVQHAKNLFVRKALRRVYDKIIARFGLDLEFEFSRQTKGLLANAKESRLTRVTYFSFTRFTLLDYISIIILINTDSLLLYFINMAQN